MFVKIKILITLLSVESGFRFLTDNLASAAAAVEAFLTALADIYKVHILPPPKILDPPDFFKMLSPSFLVILRFFLPPDGLESSGRLVGRISTNFHQNPW